MSFDIDMQRASPEEQELAKKIQEFLKSLTKPGERLVVRQEHGWVEVRICCDGRDRTFGYDCCLSPGHHGQCWSATKRVDFTREN